MASSSLLLPALIGLLFCSMPLMKANGDDFNLEDIEAFGKILQDYDRRIQPTDNDGLPSNISISFHFGSIRVIENFNMEMETDAYLTQKWIDSRFTNQTLKGVLKMNDHRVVKKVWKPEVFFATATDAEFQYVAVPNVKVEISPNGEIIYMLRLKLRSTCLTDLSNYPFDTQICQLQIAPFAKNSVLRWENKDEPITISQDVRLPKFELTETTAKECKEKTYVGSDSCMVAEFHFKRFCGQHLGQIFLPSIVMVIIAWLCFWMDVDDLQTRGIVTMLCLLALITFGHTNYSSQASYISALDVWIGACILFVFASFLEMMLVNYIWRNHGVSKMAKGQDIVERIEQYSRISFAVSFLAFIIIFCCYYLA